MRCRICIGNNGYLVSLEHVGHDRQRAIHLCRDDACAAINHDARWCSLVEALQAQCQIISVRHASQCTRRRGDQFERSSSCRYSITPKAAPFTLSAIWSTSPAHCCGFMIALVPLAHSRRHCHDLFFAQFQARPWSGAAIPGPCCPRRIALPIRSPAAWGPRRALTAGIADERSAVLDVNVQDQRLFGGGIDKAVCPSAFAAAQMEGMDEVRSPLPRRRGCTPSRPDR